MKPGKKENSSSFLSRFLGEGHVGKRLFLALLFFLTLAAFLHFKEVRMEVLEPGTIAERYIIAQVDFEFPDEEASFIVRQQSMRDIGSVFRINEKQLSQIKTDFQNSLVTGDNWRARLPDTTFDELYGGIASLEDELLKVRFTDGRTLQKIKDAHVSVENYYFLSKEAIEEPQTLPTSFWKQINDKVFLERSIPIDVAQFILGGFEHQMWNLQEDFSSERSLKQRIQEQVPIQYTQMSAGEHIVDPGERVTMRHLSMLHAMKEAISKEGNLWSIRTISGSLLLSLILTILSIVYFRFNHPHILNALHRMTLLVTIVILTLVLAKGAEYIIVNQATHLIDAFRYPLIVPFASILIFVLVSADVALFGSAFLAIVLSVTLAIDHEWFLILNLIASWIVILFARQMHKRKEVFAVLLKVWVCCIPVILAFNLSEGTFIFYHLWQDLLSSFVFIVVIAILVIGLLPLFELVFHVLTDMTLMEYMDPNNELLRRLTVEAPGTYQHCLVVGNLAETAARAIGANALFCRVATMYHDIGKLFNPHYYTENQLGGFNIHQLLTPLESAQVIIAHVPEGEALARKYHLPQRFIDIIREHHGTTLVYFFYHKQLEQMKGEGKVDQQLFRYPGPKPHSKESVIIMLADTLEAASRSLKEINEEVLTELVDLLVKDKTEDGQLDECALTFEELGIVKKTLVKTLAIASHLRIKYPERTPKES